MASNWTTAALRELVGYISKGIAPSYAEKESDTTIRVLNQKCNRNFQISYTESRLHDTAKKKVPDERYVRKNDILINSTGAGTAGRIAQIADVITPTTVDGHMIILRSNEKVSQKYLGYALKAHQYEVLQLDEGSTGQTELNRERLLDEIMISYPDSIEEQDKIVSLLESIDKKVLINTQINDNLQQQSQALYLDFIDSHSSAEVPLTQISTIKYGKGLPKSNLQLEGYPVYGGNGIIGFYHSFMYDKPQILISCRGAASGNIIISAPKSFVTSNSLVVELNDYRYFEFLKQHMLANPLYAYATGSAQPQITIDNLRNAVVPYPSFRELESITAHLSSISSSMLSLNAENKALTELRDTLLPKLLSGEITMSDIDF